MISLISHKTLSIHLFECIPGLEIDSPFYWMLTIVVFIEYDKQIHNLSSALMILSKKRPITSLFPKDVQRLTLITLRNRQTIKDTLIKFRQFSLFMKLCYDRYRIGVELFSRTSSKLLWIFLKYVFQKLSINRNLSSKSSGIREK